MIERFSRLHVNGDALFLTQWSPGCAPPKGIVVVTHGMAEHAARYRGFARHLTCQGFSVYAHDHRGHGRSTHPGEPMGHFSDNHGWDRALADLEVLLSHAAKKHPDLPLFLFGHSMGSFLVRGIIGQTEIPLSGAIISGTAHLPAPIAKAGKRVAEFQTKAFGPRTPSWLMDRLSFGVFNLCFFPTRTPFDWLCSDPKSVDRYIKDPLCGYISTAAFFKDITHGLALIGQTAHIRRCPKSLPLLFIAGKKDPVAAMGYAPSSIAVRYRDAGVMETETILYPGARHELFGEANKETVYADILHWITQRMPRAENPNQPKKEAS